MTCIVGCEDDGKVYLGGDSIAISDDYQACVITDAKVFIVGEIAFGFAGSFRVGQLIRYGLQIPAHAKGKSDMEYLVIDVIDAIRALLTDKGAMKKENEEEEHPAEFLAGYRGHLYYIDSDFHVGRIKDGYCALGVGAAYALGSMFSTEKITDPKERINIALSSAVKWSAAVRPPFTIVVLDSKKSKTKSQNGG
jgi:ATP-dependent protease HslVU (ClpYQ) peptidase subunit